MTKKKDDTEAKEDKGYSEEDDVVLERLGEVPDTDPPLVVTIRRYYAGPAKVAIVRQAKKRTYPMRRISAAAAIALGQFLVACEATLTKYAAEAAGG